MKKPFLLLSSLLVAGAAPVADRRFDSLPKPLSNNAVASVKEGRTEELFSFRGIGPEKKWDSITNQAFSLDTGTRKWTELRLVPGAGRIAASAAAVHGRVYVFGGYLTVPDVSVYEPSTRRWYRAADLPTGVDDAVAGVYRDRFLYTVGGRSNTGPVSEVQVYSVETEKWQKATPTMPEHRPARSPNICLRKNVGWGKSATRT